MFDFDFNTADVNETIAALGIAAGGLILAWLVATLTRRVIHGFTNSTESDLDDVVVEAVRWPVIAFLAIQGVYVAILTVSYLDEHRATIRSAWVAVMLTLSVIAVRRLVVGLLGWYARVPGSDGMPGFDERSLPFLRRVLNVLVVAIGLLLILDALGISISPLLAGLGIGGLAVALALQPLLTNVFASSYIMTDASVTVGDIIEVNAGPTGVVEDIGWRAARIRTFDNNIVIVPNSTLAESIITNFDSADARADARVDCGVAYEEDLSRVEALVLEELNDLRTTLDVVDVTREPLFRYAEFGDSNVNFFVKMRANTWADSFLLKHEMVKRIHSRLAAEGIVVNYPARRLLMASEDVAGLDRVVGARGGDDR
ncbi:MAG: mechanosensitive ion channel family protein [Chloroflexi bacterium]|nr:mechanosensitive ion channel family protein [Chloroflexota bacterium]MDA1146612.1 mechanosensitive ion channel family protein [Chloroflexota bacterium]MQC82701.1 mechanosensitive ion channel family protein [Chloroflexota bacterium]